MFSYCFQFLMFQSQVFIKIFTSSFKEATTCRVELPGKNVDSVIHMLDYLYPTRSLSIDGKYVSVCQTDMEDFVEQKHYGLHMTRPGCTLLNKSLLMLTHSRKYCFE